MIIQYPATEAYLDPNLNDLAARAVEGDSYHAAVEVASSDISITLAAPNTAVDTTISFGKPFAVAPTVLPLLTGAGNVGTYINVVAVSATQTGFTLRAASGAAQTISCRWLAYGRRQ